MVKAVLMKKGESNKDITKQGILYRNILSVDKLEANVTHILPANKSPPFSHKGQEIKFLVKGELEYFVGKQKFLLQEGDMLFHDSADKHWAQNNGTGEAIMITISTPPTFTMFHRK